MCFRISSYHCHLLVIVEIDPDVILLVEVIEMYFYFALIYLDDPRFQPLLGNRMLNVKPVVQAYRFSGLPLS